jgi:hypothetical protein
MKTTLAILVLVVVAGTVYTQPPPPNLGPESPALPAPSLQPSQPKERSVSELLDEIQQIRTRKAELEKKEQTLIAEVRKLVAQQADRLNKMGLGVQAQPPVEIVPPAINLPRLPVETAPGSFLPEPAKR